MYFLIVNFGGFSDYENATGNNIVHKSLVQLGMAVMPSQGFSLRL